MIRRKRIIKKSKSKYIEYKSNKTSIIWIICIFISVCIASFIYINFVRELIYKNVYQNIAEFGEQTATQLNLAITDQKNVVHLMAESINRGHFRTEEEIFDNLREELDSYHFTRLLILDKKGNGRTSDGFEIQNYPNIDEFFNEKCTYLSENRPSLVSDNQVNIYSHVFKLNGRDRVLMAAIDSYEYKEILLKKLFGKGGTYLVNNSGTVLIDSFDNIKDSTTNIYDYFKIRYNVTDKAELQKLENMKNAIKNSEEGTFDMDFRETTGDETYFIHYEKLNINDWYVITTASDNTIAYDLIRLTIISTILCLIIVCSIVCISIYISISNQNKNHKIYKVAYIDPVTLLGNETYFKGNGSIYLAGKTARNKYIITIDINKFKALNKVYGYAFCNEILKKLGQTIRDVLPSDNITCRIANDVFASIFSYEEDINELLDKIFNEASILEVNDNIVRVNLAIGAYNILPDETDVNKILDKAYLARSQIKGLYHDNYYLFDETLENKLIEEQRLESGMEEGIKENEFIVVYQPKVFTSDEKVSGAEALVRWNRKGELIPPRKVYSII